MKSNFIAGVAISLGLSLGLSHCAAYPDLNIEKPKAEIFHQSAYVSAEVIPQAQLHNYVVELKWSEQLQNASGLVLRKFDEKGVLIQTLSLQNSGVRHVDLAVTENQDFRYELWDSSQLIDQVEVHVPMDLDLRENDYVLESDHTRVGRVLLGKDRKILANGHDIQWKLFELQAAAGAKIVSFEAAQTEGQGSPSGILDLEVAKYDGDLMIEWRGQQGAPGAKGANATGRGARGSHGSDGSSARPRGDSPFCVSQPTNGGRGHQGPQGGEGRPGFKGGDLEEIHIRILDSINGRAPALLASLGVGGAGGEGGEGGRGGEGGSAGRSSFDCRNAFNGPEGARGAMGLSGLQGDPGLILGNVCLSVEGLTLQGKCGNL